MFYISHFSFRYFAFVVSRYVFLNSFFDFSSNDFFSFQIVKWRLYYVLIHQAKNVSPSRLYMIHSIQPFNITGYTQTHKS